MVHHRFGVRNPLLRRTKPDAKIEGRLGVNYFRTTFIDRNAYVIQLWNNKNGEVFIETYDEREYRIKLF